MKNSLELTYSKTTETVISIPKSKRTNIAIMQPYFMPYLGYISLIKHTDQFYLFDTVQFIRHGWIERNRILKQNEGWLYIMVPLIKPNSRFTKIQDCLINNDIPWKSKIIAQLQIYKKKAPYFHKVMTLIDRLFDEDFIDIVSLNKRSLELICEYLDINKEIQVFSEMNLKVLPANAADEWALNICDSLQDQFQSIHYINPIGGMSFFDKEKYAAKKIDISFQKMKLEPYDQKRPQFENGLSIIDVLMFNSVEQVHEMLDNYTLL